MFQEKIIDPANESQYHYRRKDGIYAPFYIDGMADKCALEKIVASVNAEASKLRNAGYAVRGLDGVTK